MSSAEMKDKTVEALNVKQISLKKYISKVFKESSVSVVSSILCTVDIRRKVFRTLVLLLCLTGFLYQCATFLEYALQYPTDLEITIEKPARLEFPGLTFCNENGIMKSKYCAKYPGNCTLADESTCKRYPRYCTTNRTMIPREEYYSTESTITLKELEELGQKFTEFVLSMVGDKTLNGPFIRTKGFIDRRRIGCYSVYCIAGSSLQPKYHYPNEIFLIPTTKFTFNVQPEEVFIPGDGPGILFSIHSPYEAVNPFQRGIHMKPGRMYKIFVNMEKKILLPSPYKTNCLNYTEVWLSNNRSGPRTKKMCEHKCFHDFFLKFINCIPSPIHYPSKERVCLRSEVPETISDSGEIDICISKCKDECEKIKYYYDIQERYEMREDAALGEATKESGLITVEVYLDGSEVVRYQHRPQYMVLDDIKSNISAQLRKLGIMANINLFKTNVELFSYIGGFIDVWLGVSFVQVMDLLEALCRIFTYVCRKRYPRDYV